MGLNGLNHKEKNEKLMDPVGWRILEELQADARINFVELGRRVGLTSPAVAERVRRMEDAGIITGYRVMVDPIKVGLPIVAIIRLRASNCRIAMERITMNYDGLPEILECYRVTGEDSLVMRIAVASMPHLESVVDRLNGYGETITSIVFSSFQSPGVCPQMFPMDQADQED
jgi:Lrp/AsnC family transcriptional regulator, leucine-responsive regulatory protein